VPSGGARERHNRPYGEHSSDSDLEFGKDYDHVLYSSSFRRLGGVTQVVGVANETALLHNRMTHSLKVAQVGRRLTKKLLDKIGNDPTLWNAIETYGGGLNSRVVHAACIAHDLGLPPFGQVAEKALRKVLSNKPDTTDWAPGAELFPRVGEHEAPPDSFDSSAQTFRIVNKLAFRESYGGGKSAALNLTKATLAALMKYPWAYRERRNGLPAAAEERDYFKWGYYDSEESIFEFVRPLIVMRNVVRHNGEIRKEFRTIEAQVMDWADDISYAIHDVEDFFRARLIPLDTLAWSDERFSDFFDYAWPRVERELVNPASKEPERTDTKARVAQFLDEARSKLPSRPYAGTRADREDLHEFASDIIRSATDNVDLSEDGLVRPAERDLAIIEVFKQLTNYYVIYGSTFTPVQRGQIYLIRQLFRDLAGWVREDYPDSARGITSIPPRLLEYVEIAFDRDPAVGCVNYDVGEQKVRRAVVDYICSLTERQAIRLSALLRGDASRPLLGDLIL
jgi:dGTPase